MYGVGRPCPGIQAVTAVAVSVVKAGGAVAAPVWSTPSGSLGSVHEASTITSGSFSVTATGVGVTYSVTSGALPTGASLDANTGAITGPAVTVGSNTDYNFTITATNGGGSVARAFLITVNNNTFPVWTTAAGSLGSVDEGNSDAFAVAATDSDGLPSSITYSVIAGALPSGYSLNSSTGAITGTAAAVGSDTTANFTIRASDGLDVADRAFAITVNDVPVAPFSGNLVRHYDFSDDANLVLSGSTITTATDLTGNANATGVNSVTRTASQINGIQAAVFTDTADGNHFTFSDTGLPSGDSSRTMAVVVRPTKSIGAGMAILGYGTFTTNQQFSIAIKETTDYWFSWGFAHDDVSTTAYSPSTNYRVILTYDSGTGSIVMHVNGSDVVNTTTADFNTTLNQGVIGNPVDPSWEGDFDFEGAIGEVLIYDRALSGAEITTLDSYLSTAWSF